MGIFCKERSRETYGAATRVTPKVIEPDRRLLIEWDRYTGRTTVEWKLASLEQGTFASVAESGWTGDADELLRHVVNSTYLEHKRPARRPK